MAGTVLVGEIVRSSLGPAGEHGLPKKKGRSLGGPGPSSSSLLLLLLLAAHSGHGVIVMYGAVKPAKVSVYVQLSSVGLPAWNSGVQFGFGQGSARSRSGLTDCAGTRSRPFLDDLTVPPLSAEKVVSWDSTTLPPWLRQSTTPEYSAVRTSSAFVLPTPPSSYALQVTVRPFEPTVHPGSPVCTCVPDGAFAGVIVSVITAEATEADRPSNKIDNAVMIEARRIFLGTPLVGSPNVSELSSTDDVWRQGRQ